MSVRSTTTLRRVSGAAAVLFAAGLIAAPTAVAKPQPIKFGTTQDVSGGKIKFSQGADARGKIKFGQAADGRIKFVR